MLILRKGYFIYCGPRIYFFRFGASTPSVTLGSGAECSETGVPQRGSLFFAANVGSSVADVLCVAGASTNRLTAFQPFRRTSESVIFGDSECTANRGGISESSSFKPTAFASKEIEVSAYSFIERAALVDSGNNR